MRIVRDAAYTLHKRYPSLLLPPTPPNSFFPALVFRLPERQPEDDDRESEEPDARPLGDREAEQPPVDLGAAAGAGEDARERLAQRQRVEDELEVRAAGLDLGREVLQVRVAQRDAEPGEPEQRDNGGVRLESHAAGTVEGGHERHDRDGDEG